jgi:hypothetical protein
MYGRLEEKPFAPFQGGRLMELVLLQNLGITLRK